MRVLHTGDLHLDSAFCAYGPRDAEARRSEGRELLRRIFECARKESCQMILLSGDVFDSRYVTPETGELFCSLVKDCGIPVVVAPGNHDFYGESSFYAKAQRTLGDALTLFTSSELQVFDFEELRVRVFGYAFTSQNLTESPLGTAQVPQDDGFLKIFCAHGDLSSPLSRKGPLTLAEISKFDFDYSALGHIHNVPDREDLEGRVRYCGFAQGRGFDELGEGGVWIVDVERDSITSHRVVLSVSQFRILQINTNSDGSALQAELAAFIGEQGFDKTVDLRILLEGNYDGESKAELQALMQALCAECGLRHIEIRDERLPFLDALALENDCTLRGELYRVLKSQLLSADAEERRLALKALRIGLAAIDSKNIYDFYK